MNKVLYTIINRNIIKFGPIEALKQRIEAEQKKWQFFLTEVRFHTKKKQLNYHSYVSNGERKNLFLCKYFMVPNLVQRKSFARIYYSKILNNFLGKEENVNMIFHIFEIEF